MAVLQPHEMDFTNKKFSMIIAGSPGVGKTTLAMSAPNPVLIDLEGGVSRVKAQHRETTIVAKTYEEMLEDIESSSVRQAETLVIDTGGSLITYLMDWAVRKNPKIANNNMQKFAAIKKEFTSITNRLQHTFDKHIIYIFHTVEEKKGDVVTQRLLCEGSARNTVWQPCDLGAYFYMDGEQRVLGFTPTEEYFAKGCYGIVGLHKVPNLTAKSKNDFLTKLFKEAHKTLEAENSRFIKQREGYAQAMKDARGIIENISDAGSANSSRQAFKAIKHFLTSERESGVLFKAKIAALNLVWDNGEGAYVPNDAQPSK